MLHREVFKKKISKVGSTAPSVSDGFKILMQVGCQAILEAQPDLYLARTVRIRNEVHVQTFNCKLLLIS